MRRLLPLAAVVALTLAACGDDGMSASEYRSAAKKVCVDAEKATDAVEQPTRSTPEAIVDYLERLLQANEKVLQSSTSRLRDLGNRSNAAAERLGVRECVQ